jgi:hypothetical protein
MPPLGIIMPWEFGDLTNKTNIRTTTRHGNSKTNPSGTEIEESPLSRMRRRKKANLGETFSARRDRVSNWSMLFSRDGILLLISCNSPIAAPECRLVASWTM